MYRPLKIDKQADREALHWFLETRNSADLPPERWQAFIHWLRADPRHDQLLSDYETLWGQIKELEGDREFLSYALEEPLVGRRSFVRKAQDWFNPVLSPWFLAACLAIASVWVYYHGSEQEYETVVGQQKIVSLRDGSSVTLNTDSRVSVRYLPWRRSVMLQHGEAYFTVAHERWRPFWVAAGSGRIRAVGTRFGVRKDSDAVTVALVEGRVLVNTAPEFNEQQILQSQVLNPGEFTRYTSDGVQSKAEQGNVLTLTQWTTGRLSFTSARLADVVQELNRYSLDKLRIGDPALEDQKISAYFQIGKVSSFIEGLHYLIGIDHYRDSQSMIVLVKQKEVKANNAPH